MKYAFAALALALAAATPAQAGPGEYRGRVERHVPASLTREQAVIIARENGVFDVHEIRLRSGVWIVTGHTNDNDAIEVSIDGQTGAVISRVVEE